MPISSRARIPTAEAARAAIRAQLQQAHMTEAQFAERSAAQPRMLRGLVSTGDVATAQARVEQQRAAAQAQQAQVDAYRQTLGYKLWPTDKPITSRPGTWIGAGGAVLVVGVLAYLALSEETPAAAAEAA